MNGPQHYSEAERLLALARDSKETTFEGHNPEADRTIAEAHVHALLALTAAYAIAQPIAEQPESGGHMSQDHYEEWVEAVEIRDGMPIVRRPCAECPQTALTGRAYCSTRCRNAADRHDEMDGDL